MLIFTDERGATLEQGGDDPKRSGYDGFCPEKCGAADN